jgi:3-oxoacyl-[acyl-carrier protein] reductase
MRVLVTGGSRGLGRALVAAFAKSGAQVAFTWRSRQAEAQATEAATGARAFQGDVADPAHASAVVAALDEAWGGVDVLVNNAGALQVLPFALLELADWEAAFATHARGTFVFTKAVVQGMVRRRSGHVLNVGSVFAERPTAAPVHLAAAKGAVHGFTFALAHELGPYGVRVNLVVPGLLDGGQGARLPAHHRADYAARSAPRRLLTPDEVADVVVSFAAEDLPNATGAVLRLDGGA